MGFGKISSKQQEILDYIKNVILNKGYPPSVREICEAVSLKSTSSVHAHLETLEEKGFIRKDPTKPRAIEILDDTFVIFEANGMPSHKIIILPVIVIDFSIFFKFN